MQKLTRFLFVLFCCNLFVWLVGAASAETTATDMLTFAGKPGNCLTVSGDLTAAPALVARSCRGTSDQLWEVGADGKWHTALDTNYCVAGVNSTNSGQLTTLYLCTDSRTFAIVKDASNPVYLVSGTTVALDYYGSQDRLGLYSQHNGTNQQWKWLAEIEAIVNNSSLTLTYPMNPADASLKELALATEQLAFLQPPSAPRVTYNTTAFPGNVATSAPKVSQSFLLDRNFPSNSYMQSYWPPQNWMSTGLYAPANATIKVTVNNTNGSDVDNVYVRISPHTDTLPDSASSWARPRVASNEMKLELGENLIRNPLGGLIYLVSKADANIIVDITVADAVEAPHFIKGVTNSAEWSTRQTAPGAWGEIEGDLAILTVPSDRLNTISYDDALYVADYFDNLVMMHNDLSGMDNSTSFNRTPTGKQRFVTDIQISAGYAHSGYPLMFHPDFEDMANATLLKTQSSWGEWHELGHNYQQIPWAFEMGTEVTTNLFSLHTQELLFGTSRLVDNNNYQKALDHLAAGGTWSTADVWSQLVFHMQIVHAFPQGWDSYSKLMQIYRGLDSATLTAVKSNGQTKRDAFLKYMCQATGHNLTQHFETWGIVLTDAPKTDCAAYPNPDVNISAIAGPPAATPTPTPGGATATAIPNATATPTLTNTPMPTNTPTVVVTPSATPTTTSGGSCATLPQYVAGTTYTLNQIVKNSDTAGVEHQYRCIEPGWCSSAAAWAYEPGKGTASALAWEDDGVCTAGSTATPVPPTVTNTPIPPTNTPIPTNTPTISPCPLLLGREVLCTPPPPTNTPIPTNTPTISPCPLLSGREVLCTPPPPTNTPTPTNTPVPATNTPTPTNTPTISPCPLLSGREVLCTPPPPTNTPTPTNTPVPATNTPTPTNTPTISPCPLLSGREVLCTPPPPTNTPVPVTNTPTPTPDVVLPPTPNALPLGVTLKQNSGDSAESLSKILVVGTLMFALTVIVAWGRFRTNKNS